MSNKTDGTATHKVDDWYFKANKASGYALYWAGKWKESQWMRNDALTDEFLIDVKSKVIGIPIAWVRENICELVAGDEIYNSHHEQLFVLDPFNCAEFNTAREMKTQDGDSNYLLTKFAARKNTGVQPVADGVAVNVAYEGRLMPTDKVINWAGYANRVADSFDWGDIDLEAWNPNYQKALKMYEESLVADDTKLTYDKCEQPAWEYSTAAGYGAIKGAQTEADAFWDKAPREYDHYIVLENGTGFGDYYKLDGDEYVNQNGGSIGQGSDNITVTYRWSCDDFISKSRKQKTIDDIAKVCGFGEGAQLPERIYDAIGAGEIHNTTLINSK